MATTNKKTPKTKQPVDKQASFFKQHLQIIEVVTAAFVLAVVFLFTANYVATHPAEHYKEVHPKSKLPYVDGGDATSTVDAFYKSYIRQDTPVANRMKLVNLVGSMNLAFYAQYYQHGFDPIVCSSTMPTKTTAELVSTGPVAHVNVTATYPDNSKQIIETTVVLNDDGLKVDSITCPGNKGNLPPQTTPADLL